ncbi:MAG: hypothetical protein ABL923_06695 [Burkholderiaceae bacterium]
MPQKPKPTDPSGEFLRKTPVAGAFKRLVADMREAMTFKDSRKKLDAILVQADVERQAGSITAIEYHKVCEKWHSTLITLMRQNRKS